jgi:hypothetical protein
MEGAGMFALIGGAAIDLLRAPFQLIGAVVWMVRAHAQRRRSLSPHELNLRRASHPVGVAAVLFAMHSFYGARISQAITTIPLDRWALMTFAGVVLIFGLASFVSGVNRCAGMPDSILATRAFFKLAVGTVICVYVGRLPLWRAYLDASLFPYLAPPLFLIGLWCVVTGAVRLLLLVVPLSGALATIRKLLRKRNRLIRPARRRRFWWFW